MRILDYPNESYLKLENVGVHPNVVRRLPLTAARGYHAIPVAEEAVRITGVCPRFLVCSPAYRIQPGAIQDLNAENELDAYARELGKLLNAEITSKRLEKTGLSPALSEEIHQGVYELVLCTRQSFPFLKHQPVSLLVVQRPRYALTRILMPVVGEETGDSALDWAIRLARASQGAVTVLTVVSPAPIMYHGLPHMQPSLPDLLVADTPFGQRIRHMAKQLADRDIHATLRLRTGHFFDQVQEEIKEGGYDMILLTPEPPSRLRRLLWGDVVGMVLKWVKLPVLLAKPGIE